MISLDKVRNRIGREAKHARLRIRPHQSAPHPLLNIVGCQRSGTTMLTELLDRDSRIRVYGELGGLFDDVPRHHRLRDSSLVRAELARSGAALDVVKPLVESHRCRELIDLEHDGLAVWMFRHYSDVASSNLRRFGETNGVDNLRPIVGRDGHDWRNAGLSDDTRRLVDSLFDDDMVPIDAAALFWYCRNTLWFEQGLESEDRIRTCRYEQLVAEPDAVVEALYAWVGLEPPDSDVSSFVHAKSVGRGQEQIGAEVRRVCDDMWERLTDTDSRRSLTSRS